MEKYEVIGPIEKLQQQNEIEKYNKHKQKQQRVTVDPPTTKH